MAVVDALCGHGVGKITFAGGEPTLCPWLRDLVSLAKSHDVTTMVVTNGTRLDQAYLEPFRGLLDWVCLSIDSLDPAVNLRSGRAVGRRAFDEGHYRSLCELIVSLGFRLKVNTVVHALNAGEDMSSFILAAKPERWKLFQVLPVKGQNDESVDELIIPETAFQKFVKEHRSRMPEVMIVPESNDAMRGSYLMIDPAGRFYDNTRGGHTYSAPILNVGVAVALEQIRFDADAFAQRGGHYDWVTP